MTGTPSRSRGPYARTARRRQEIARAVLRRLYAALAGDATVPGHPAQEYFAEH